MRKVVTGEQIAQIYNPDPFARPVWRAPVYQTPFGVIAAVHLVRLLAWIIRMIIRHPVAAAAAAVLGFMWVSIGWIGPAALVVWAALVLMIWRCYWPGSFPTWDQALDGIGKDDQPRHVVRFGDRFDAQGVLAGSKDAARCIGYLTKYLTKQVGAVHQAESDAQRAHATRLPEALRYELCSPTCTNWLRYGIQPKNTSPGMRPGACKSKAHDSAHLGYAGRRVLVSRKWSGKTLADHRADRQDWLLKTLGASATDPDRYRWQLAPRATRTTWTVADGCCTPSPTAHGGKQCFARPDVRPGWPPLSFRQPRGRRHDI